MLDIKINECCHYQVFNTAIILLKIAIRWATLKIGSLEAGAVAAPWFKDPAKDDNIKRSRAQQIRLSDRQHKRAMHLVFKIIDKAYIAMKKIYYDVNKKREKVNEEVI